MFSIYAGDELIYSNIYPKQDRKVSSPTLKMAVDSAGSLDFTIPVTNSAYVKLERMKTIVTVKKGNDELWTGRVINDDMDFHKNRKVYCEGSLAFLNDSCQLLCEYRDVNFGELVAKLLDVHNAAVGDDRAIYFGGIAADLIVPEIEYWGTIYESTIDVIAALCDKFHAHYLVKRVQENDKWVNKLYFFKEILNKSDQTVVFGKNLVDFTQSYDLSKLATVLIPLSETDSDEDEPKSVGTAIDLDTPSEYDPDKGYGVIVPKTEHMWIDNIDDKMNQIELSFSNYSGVFTPQTEVTITPTWGNIGSLTSGLKYANTQNQIFQTGYQYKVQLDGSDIYDVRAVIATGSGELEYKEATDVICNIKKAIPREVDGETYYKEIYVDLAPRNQNGSPVNVDLRVYTSVSGQPTLTVITQTGTFAYNYTNVIKDSAGPGGESTTNEVQATYKNENAAKKVNLQLIQYENSSGDTVTSPLTYVVYNYNGADYLRHSTCPSKLGGSCHYVPADYVTTYLGLYPPDGPIAIADLGTDDGQFENEPFLFEDNVNIAGRGVTLSDGLSSASSSTVRDLDQPQQNLYYNMLQPLFNLCYRGCVIPDYASDGWNHGRVVAVLQLNRRFKSVYVSGTAYTFYKLAGIWRIKPDAECNEDLWVPFAFPGDFQTNPVICSYEPGSYVEIWNPLRIVFQYNDLDNENLYKGYPLAKYVIDGTAMMLNPNKVEFVKWIDHGLDQKSILYYKRYKFDIPDDVQGDQFLLAINGGHDMKISISSEENSEAELGKLDEDGLKLDVRYPWTTTGERAYKDVYDTANHYGVFVALTEKTALHSNEDIELYIKNNNDPEKERLYPWVHKMLDNLNRTFSGGDDSTGEGHKSYNVIFDMEHPTSLEDNDYRTCAVLVRASYQEPNGRKHPHSIWITSQMKNHTAFYMIFDYCKESTNDRSQNADWPNDAKFYYVKGEFGKYVGAISKIEQKKVTMPYSTNPDKLMLVLVSSYESDPQIWVDDPSIYNRQKYLTIAGANDGSVYLIGTSLNKFTTQFVYGGIDVETGKYEQNSVSNPYAAVVTEDFIAADRDGTYMFSVENPDSESSIMFYCHIYRYDANGNYIGPVFDDEYHLAENSPATIFSVRNNEKFKIVLYRSTNYTFTNLVRNPMFYKVDELERFTEMDFINGKMTLDEQWVDPNHQEYGHQYNINTDTSDTSINPNRLTLQNYFYYSNNKRLNVDVFLDENSPLLTTSFTVPHTNIFDIEIDVWRTAFSYSATAERMIYAYPDQTSFIDAPTTINQLKDGRGKLSIRIYRTVIDGNGYEIDPRHLLEIDPSVIDKVILSESDPTGTQKPYTPPNTSFETYGRIEKRVVFDNVETSAELYDKAVEYMNASRFDEMTLKANAIDLTILGEDVGNLCPGDSINVSSPPHGLDKGFPISSLSIPLDRADSSRYDLGYSKKDTLNDILKGESKW